MMLCRTCAEAHKSDCSFKDEAVKKDELDSDNDQGTDHAADPSSSDEVPDPTPTNEEADCASAESEASASQAPSRSKIKEGLLLDIARCHQRFTVLFDSHHKRIKEALVMRDLDQMRAMKGRILSEVMNQVPAEFEELA